MLVCVMLGRQGRIMFRKNGPNFFLFFEKKVQKIEIFFVQIRHKKSIWSTFEDTLLLKMTSKRFHVVVN